MQKGREESEAGENTIRSKKENKRGAVKHVQSVKLGKW